SSTVHLRSISSVCVSVGGAIPNVHAFPTRRSSDLAGLLAGEVLMYSHDNGSTWTDISSAVTGTAVSYADAGLTSTSTILMQVESSDDHTAAHQTREDIVCSPPPDTTVTIDSSSVDR